MTEKELEKMTEELKRAVRSARDFGIACVFGKNEFTGEWQTKDYMKAIHNMKKYMEVYPDGTIILAGC